MNKLVISISVLLLFACSSDDSISTEENIIISAPNSTSEASNNTESETSNTSSTTTSDTSSTTSDTSIDTFTVTILSSEGGTVSGDSGEYDLDSEIQLTASPDEGYFFSGWEGIDDDNETITLTVNSNIDLEARFLSLPSLNIEDNIDVPYAADFKVYTKSQEGELGLNYSAAGGFESISIISSYGSVNFTQPNEGELGGEISINYTALEINNPNPNITIAGEDYLEFQLTDLYGNTFTKSATIRTQPEPVFKNYLKSSHDNQVSRLNLLDFYEIRHREGKADRFFCEYGEQTPGLYQDAIISVGIIDINGDGYEDFVIPPTFNGDNDGIGEWSSRKIEYEAYVYTRGEYIFSEEVWGGNIPSSYTARKALVADFDGDGDGDIYFACTGMDLDPYPREREKSWLLINEGDGTLGLKEIDDYMTSHDATAADFDGDGDIDLFSIGYVPDRFNGYHIGILENIGGNNFIRKETFSGNSYTTNDDYFNLITSSEAADINNDGYMDVVWGGSEFLHSIFGPKTGHLRIELGSMSGKFNTDNSIFVPRINGYGVILDIDFYDIDNDGTLEIIVNRSGDSLNDNGQFPEQEFGFNEQIGETYYYGGYYIQIIKLVNNQAVDVTNQFIDNNFYRAFSDGCDPQSDWIRWLVIQDYDNDGNIDIFNPLIYFWGEGHESLRRWEWNGSRFTRINP